MPGRKATPDEIELRVLDRSRRRCALCVHFDQDYRRKKGQLAHIDRNPSNSSEENLAYLCLDHHDDYDTRQSQTKSLTQRELKAARARLYLYIERGGDLSGGSRRPSGIKADRKTLAELQVAMEKLPDYFLSMPNFGGCSFSRFEIEVFRAAVEDRNKPQCEFIDQELEELRRRFIDDGHVLIRIIDRRLVRAPQNDWYQLPIEWRESAPERLERIARIMDQLAVKAGLSYDELIRTARRKLED